METSQNGTSPREEPAAADLSSVHAWTLGRAAAAAATHRGELTELVYLALIQHAAAERAGELLRALRARAPKVPYTTLAVLYGKPLASMHRTTSRPGPVYSKRLPAAAEVEALLSEPQAS